MPVSCCELIQRMLNIMNMIRHYVSNIDPGWFLSHHCIISRSQNAFQKHINDHWWFYEIRFSWIRMMYGAWSMNSLLGSGGECFAPPPSSRGSAPSHDLDVMGQASESRQKWVASDRCPSRDSKSVFGRNLVGTLHFRRTGNPSTSFAYETIHGEILA